MFDLQYSNFIICCLSHFITFIEKLYNSSLLWSVVDGKAQLIAENPKPVAGPKILAADHQAKELERLEKEVRFTEGAMPPERACELACEFLKQQDNDPLLDKLDDTSPWNRNNEPNQACCTLS